MGTIYLGLRQLCRLPECIPGLDQLAVDVLQQGGILWTAYGPTPPDPGEVQSMPSVNPRGAMWPWSSGAMFAGEAAP